MKIPMIVGLCGYAGSGKDTLADMLAGKYGYEKVAFADPLKRTVVSWLLFNDEIPADVPGFILNLISECRNQVSSPVNTHDYVYTKPYSPELRKLVQYVGTEYFRAKDGAHWLKAMQLEPGKKYVVSDVRFKNELDYVHLLNGVVFRIDRECQTSTDAHSSESGIKDLAPVLVIGNKQGSPELMLHSFDVTCENIYRTWEKAVSWVDHE